MSRVLVSHLPGETRVARIDNGRLRDLAVLLRDAPLWTGRLYRARVRRMDKRVGGAFLDLGEGVDGFLPMEEAAKLTEGQAVVVKVTRPPREDKGPRVSRRLDPSTACDGDGAPALLRDPGEPVTAILDFHRPEEKLLVDDADLAASLRAAGRDAEFFGGPRPLFESEGVEAEIEELLEPEVFLRDKARLWIEPTRALVAIDVDAGAGRALDVNLAAAAEIPRQLHLRGLSGLVVVDFLDLPAEGQRREVVTALKSGMASDPARYHLGALDEQGVMTMTREYLGRSLLERLCRPCGLGGSGWEKRSATHAFEALRAALAEGLAAPGEGLAIHASAEVIAAIEEEAPALSVVARRLGRAPDLVEEGAARGWRIVIGSPR